LRTSTWVPLDNPGDDRERNKLDVYGPIYLADLGTITRIDIFFDHSNSSPDWLLAWVAVYPTFGGQVTFFEYYNWLKAYGTYTIYPS
jgi:hypothetical protein